MRRDWRTGLGALAVAASASWAQAADVAAEIVGTWRGTSTCVDRVLAPACNDEVVVYEIVPVNGKPGVVTWTADKIVNGERGTMGVFDLTRDGPGRWTKEFESRRHERLRWVIDVDGAHMTGALEMPPDGTVVRRLKLEREQARPAPQP